VTQILGHDGQPESGAMAPEHPASERPARAGSRLPGAAIHAGALAWFLLIAVYVTWPLAAHAGTSVLGNLGDPLEVAWRIAWGAHAVVEQPLHLFEANMFHPEPLTLAYSENHLGVAALVAPLFWATGNALLSYNVAILLVLAAGGFGVYLLVWEVTGERGPALVAGTAYAALPFRVSMATLGHVHVIALHFTPLVLVLLLQLRRDRSWWRVAALAVLIAGALWSSLTGAFMTLVAIGTFALWETVRLRRRVWPWLWRTGLAVMAGLVAALPVLLPYREVRHLHPDYRHPESEAIALSATAGAYLNPPRGGPTVRWFYEDLAERFSPATGAGEKELFPGLWLTGAGVVTVGVAAVAAARRRHRDNGSRLPAGEVAAFCGLLTVVAMVLSFGPHYGARPDGPPMPFGVVNALTGGTLQRAPARIGALALLALAVLAGIGLSWARRPLRRALVGASLAVLVIEFMPVNVDLVKPPARTAAHAHIAGRDGAVLGLPTIEWDAQGGLILASLPRESQHLYLSTEHWRPMTNGWGAYHPPAALAFAAAMADIPSPAAFRALRERNVRTVVVQTGLTAGTRWEGVEQRLAGWPGVRLLERGTGVVVFDISAAGP
jgi:hypothetical protein